MSDGLRADPQEAKDLGGEPSSPVVEVARWFGPMGSRKFHYFGDDLRSLCGKWMLWRDPEAVGLGWGVAEWNASGDCATCTKKLTARALGRDGGES